MENKYEIKINKKDNIVDLTISFLLFFMLIIVLINPEILYDEDNVFLGFDYNHLIYILTGAFGLFGLFFMIGSDLKPLIKKQPLVVVNENGIIDNSHLFVFNKFILWQEITSIKYEKRRINRTRVKLIVIYLTNNKEIRLSIPKYQIEDFKYNLPRQFSKQISENNILIDFDLT